MRFSLITPSFGQLDWLSLCAASISDQAVECEHLVQDAGSPGIDDWRRSHPEVQVLVEKDTGMYDAINRGLLRARGEICSYLNSDEQYLPGVLRRVGDYFERHPEIDVIFGDSIVAGPTLVPLSYRRAVLPRRGHTVLYPLGVLTCSTFFRRKLVDDGVLFDTSWKIIGDKAWVLSLLDRGYRMAVLSEPLAVFTLTGFNLSRQKGRLTEKIRWEKLFSPSLRYLRPLVYLQHLLDKWQAGAYRPFTGDLRYYLWDNVSHRTTFPSINLSPFWPKQLNPVSQPESTPRIHESPR